MAMAPLEEMDPGFTYFPCFLLQLSSIGSMDSIVLELVAVVYALAPSLGILGLVSGTVQFAIKDWFHVM